MYAFKEWDELFFFQIILIIYCVSQPEYRKVINRNIGDKLIVLDEFLFANT